MFHVSLIRLKNELCLNTRFARNFNDDEDGALIVCFISKFVMLFYKTRGVDQER